MLLGGLACLGLLWIAISRRLLASFLNPLTVFVSAWVACASLLASGFVGWFPLSPGEQALLLVGVASTLAGGYVATCGARRGRRSTPRRPLPSAAVIGLALVAFGGFGILLFSLSRKVSLLVYWIAPERVEALGFQMRGVGYLNLIHLVLPACLVLQGRRTGRHRGWWYGAAALSVATTPLAGIKAYFVQSVLTGAFAALYETQRVRIRTQVVVAALAALAVFSFFVFYDEFFHEEYVDYVGEGVVHLPHELAPLARPIVYATGPLATFGPFVRFQGSVYFGKSTFRGLSRAAAAFEPVDLPSFNAEHYSAPVPFNTYSVFREYFEDGREAGVVVLGFLTGLVVQGLFLAMRARPSAPRVVLVAYVTSAQVLSPFAGFLHAPQALFFLTLLGGVEILTRPLGRFRRPTLPARPPTSSHA